MAAGTRAGSVERRQRHEEDAVGEVVQQLGRGLQRQAGLAGAAGTGQGQQPHVGPAQQARRSRRTSLLPAQERGRLAGQVVAAGVQAT